jgi:C4-dicarboxylate transporter, DctM subunit
MSCRGLRDIPLTTFFRRTAPFVVADVIHVGLQTAIPALSLWLPNV